MKYNMYVLVVVLFLSVISCKKSFLDVENTQQLFRESYVKDLGSMEEYLNGSYLIFARHFEEGMAAAYPDLAADNLRPLLPTASAFMTAHYNWGQISDGNDAENNVGSSPRATAMDPLWRTGYLIVRACSFVVEDVDKYRDENTAKGDYLKGQALALRAYVFFKLVNTFAQTYSYTSEASHLGIPYITTSDITKPYTRQTVAEVYNGMIADLNSAIALLPVSASDTRYMNRNAAKALLARVYLFKGDFDNAKTLAVEIADQYPLMTIAAGYPDGIFKFKSPSQTETLFQVTPSAGTSLGFWVGFSPVRRFVATKDIADVLMETSSDIRRNWVKDTIIGGTPFHVIKKFPKGVAGSEVNPPVPIPELSYYRPVIRSSEMFLIVAEASARTNDESTARTYLDAIRKRADPSVPSVTTSGASLLNAIYDERRKELAFESLRMYDLQRWKKGVNRTDVISGSPTNLPYPSNKAIAPIPFRDVKLAGLSQNQGY